MRFSTPVAIGLAGVVVVAVAVPVALARHDSPSAAAVHVAPLSATDRRVLTESRALIDGLPAALASVPLAARDASGGRVSTAGALAVVRSSSGLAPLARAITAPTSVVGGLTAGFDDVLAGRAAPSVDTLAPELEQLQAIEGDIVPAVRVVAAHSGHSLSAAAALAAVERDPQTRALGALLAGWQAVYGTFTLVEQAAAS
jgi:hypothetical protein